MDQLAPSPPPSPPSRPRRKHGGGVSSTLVVLGTLGVTGAAAWLYFRIREPAMDQQTWERLRPRGGTGA